MRISYKKIAIAVLSFALIFGSFYISAKSRDTTMVGTFDIEENPIIIVDAGHGGFDGGAVADDGTVEKDINLLISLRLGELLKTAGYTVIYTRTDDSAVDTVSSDTISSRKKSDLNNRLELINTYKNAVFISIHLNKFTSTSANGAQVFYSPKNSESPLLAESIQSQIISLLQNDNKRVIKKADKSIYLLYNAQIPAVIVECGFLSNKKELELLKDSEYQSKMAFSVFCGILKYYSNQTE